MSWSQPRASKLVGSVMRKIIGMRPAWKRKYLFLSIPIQQGNEEKGDIQHIPSSQSRTDIVIHIL